MTENKLKDQQARPMGGGLSADWFVLSAGEVVRGGHRGSAIKTAWLLSFVDLTSILVGFFVLVFATQTMEQEKWSDVTGSLRAAFTPPVAAAPIVVPNSSPNGLAVVRPQRETLVYLDSLLRSQLVGDEVWGNLVGVVDEEGGQREMVYEVENKLLNVEQLKAQEAWVRLGGVVRSWKNPVAVRWVVPPQDENVLRAAAQMMAVVGILSRMGVNVVGEIVLENEEQPKKMVGVYWVIGEGF